MTSVLRCGDDGCPCRNLPAEVDRGDTERLRAENAELRARLAEMGGARTEWTYQVGGFIGASICRSAESAEALASDLRRQGWQAGGLVSRLVTPWRLDGSEGDAREACADGR